MKKILIADDDREDVEYIVDIVRERGWSAEVVEDGDAALEAMRAGGFAGVILDNRMPGLSGVDVLAQLCAEHQGPPLPPPPIALFTADEQAARAAIERGATWYIHKDQPQILQEFLDAVRFYG